MSQTKQKVNCYHCGEACQEAVIQFDDHDFCCHGCQTVYTLLKDRGLGNYYCIENAPGKTKNEATNNRDFLELSEVMLGSVASGVIQNAPCSVIVVPGSYGYRAPKNILFASDLKSGVHQNDVDLIEKIAGQNKGKITFLTVVKDESELPMSEVEHGYDLHVQFQDLDHDFEVINSDNVERAIANFALVNEMDMVVTIPRKASWFSRILNPSVSKKLAQHINIPVLALTN